MSTKSRTEMLKHVVGEPKKNKISLKNEDTMRKLISTIRSLSDNLTVEEVFQYLFEVTPDWITSVKNSKKLHFYEYIGEFTLTTDTHIFLFHFAREDDPESTVKDIIEVPLYDEGELIDLQNTILLKASGEDSKLEELVYISRYPNEIKFDEKIYLPNLKKVSIPNYETVHTRMIPAVETICIINPSRVDISLDKIPKTLKKFSIPPRNQLEVISETPDFFGFVKSLKKKVPGVKVNVKEATEKTWYKNHIAYMNM